MELNSPVNLENLNQLFIKYDSDQDGKVDANQTLTILNEIGYEDIYIGTINKVIKHIN